jgi:hypothetical protein
MPARLSPARTKKTSTFTPPELNGIQIAADSSDRVASCN